MTGRWTAWCPIILQSKSGFEVHIMWKDSHNNLKQHKKFEKKEAFGKGVNASVVREGSNEKKDELAEYFKTENEYGVQG